MHNAAIAGLPGPGRASRNSGVPTDDDLVNRRFNRDGLNELWVSDIPAGSGMTSGKHRSNHGGHRQLNAAIYRTVIVRMRFHEPTIAYVARLVLSGDSPGLLSFLSPPAAVERSRKSSV
jgi:hypothetical protein